MYSLREMVLHKHKNLCGSSVQQTLRKFRRFVRNCLKFLFRLVYLFGFPWCEMKADLVLFWGLLFFFFDRLEKIHSKNCQMQKAPAYQKYKKRSRKQKQKNINYKEGELKKRGRESLDVSRQALAQSNRELEKRASIWSSNLSKSSNVRRLRSFPIHHIKHNETKFQM